MDLSTRTDNSDKSDGLLLNPSTELKFKGPFDDFVTVTLSIQNPTDKRIAFKIKTTAPKRYCVKPNSGVLSPTEAVKVNVLLQPFQYDPSEKNKHKFMVQYVYLNEEERKMNANDILNLWKDMPQERLLDIKLRCTFEPSENEPTSTTTTTTPQQITPPSTISSTGLTSAQPTQQSVTKSTSNTNNTSSISSHSIPVAQVSVQPQNESKLTSRSLRSSDSTNTNIVKSESSLNDLKEENERLRKEIERFKEEESRLKKMALQDSSKKSQTTNSQQQFDIQQLVLNKSIWVIVLLIAIIIYLLFIK